MEEYDIVILTETKAKKKHETRFRGYQNISTESVGASGGTTILVKKDIKVQIIERWENVTKDFDILGIRLGKIENKNNIIAIYRRPKGQLTKQEWQKIFNFNQISQNTIFMGDFNAHNCSWNCDNNGDILQNLMYDKKFICINTDTMSRLSYVNQHPSNIDLAFYSEKILDKINYTQLQDTWGSDHYPISFKMNNALEIYRKKSNRISTKKTRWKEYTREISNELENATLTFDKMPE